MTRVCVGALLVKQEGVPYVLLGKRALHRAFYPDVWDMPGGHCEPGEVPERTLVRELSEEIGVTPTAWYLLDEVRAEIPEEEESLILHLYVVTGWIGTPHNCMPEEHSEVAWFTLDDACSLTLAHPAYQDVFRRLASLAQ